MKGNSLPILLLSRGHFWQFFASSCWFLATVCEWLKCCCF